MKDLAIRVAVYAWGAFLALYCLAHVADYFGHETRGRTAAERDEIRARAALSAGWRRVVDGPRVGR